MVEKSREGRDVRRLCELLGVSRSGFYAWLSRPKSERSCYDDKLKQAMVELHQGFRRAYGARRIHQQLRKNGFSCSVRRVSRLMKEAGIHASSKGLYVWNPGRHEFYSAAGNVLGAEDVAEGEGQHWAGDFTYVRTGSGWLYHAVVVDLYSRRVVGWSFSRKRNSELTKSALKMALSREVPLPGCVFHSDQGIEYAAHEYRDLVAAAGMRRSMSRKATPLDNAMVESFFHTLKTELVHQHKFENDIEAVARIVEFIEFYNRERLHSGIGYQSPESYMRACA
ncbi:IS3 family transposase [Alcanivorax sediminis]|nr:IS3 family transposase [Alcanivorax sediminis]